MPLLREPVCARLVEGVHDLAVDVDLELLARCIADAHGRRSLVTGQPRQLELRQAPLAGDAVHDLQVRGVAGNGAQEPCAPGERLVDVLGLQQRKERQRRIA